MFDDLKEIIAGIQQSRSDFQIEKFVIGAHPIPEMRYYQVLIELQDAIYKYELAHLQVKKAEIQIENLRLAEDELSQIEMQELELGLEQTKFAMIGHERELKTLLKIFDSFEHKFTRQEIEDAQPEYWKQRLTNNANAMMLGGGAVNAPHIEAMQQAGVFDKFLELVIENKRELQ